MLVRNVLIMLVMKIMILNVLWSRVEVMIGFLEKNFENGGILMRVSDLMRKMIFVNGISLLMFVSL